MLNKISKRLLVITIGLCLLVSIAYASIGNPGTGADCPSCGQQACVFVGDCAGGPDIPVTACAHYDYPHHHFRMYSASWIQCLHCGHSDSYAKITALGPILCRIEHNEYYYPHLGADVSIGSTYPIMYFQ